MKADVIKHLCDCHNKAMASATCDRVETGIQIMWTKLHAMSMDESLYSNWMLFICCTVCKVGVVGAADMVDTVDVAGMVGVVDTVDVVSAVEVVDAVDIADMDAVKGSLGMWEINIGHL